MEVRLGFSHEVKLWTEPASAGPSGGADVPALGTVASLSEARISAEPDPTPAAEEESVVEEKVAAPPQVPATGPKGPRSRGPKLAVVP